MFSAMTTLFWNLPHLTENLMTCSMLSFKHLQASKDCYFLTTIFPSQHTSKLLELLLTAIFQVTSSLFCVHCPSKSLSGAYRRIICYRRRTMPVLWGGWRSIHLSKFLTHRPNQPNDFFDVVLQIAHGVLLLAIQAGLIVITSEFTSIVGDYSLETKLENT